MIFAFFIIALHFSPCSMQNLTRGPLVIVWFKRYWLPMWQSVWTYCRGLERMEDVFKYLELFFLLNKRYMTLFCKSKTMTNPHHYNSWLYWKKPQIIGTIELFRQSSIKLIYIASINHPVFILHFFCTFNQFVHLLCLRQLWMFYLLLLCPLNVPET